MLSPTITNKLANTIPIIFNIFMASPLWYFTNMSCADLLIVYHKDWIFHPHLTWRFRTFIENRHFRMVWTLNYVSLYSCLVFDHLTDCTDGFSVIFITNFNRLINCKLFSTLFFLLFEISHSQYMYQSFLSFSSTFFIMVGSFTPPSLVSFFVLKFLFRVKLKI